MTNRLASQGDKAGGLPEVAVIVLLYNSASIVERCLDALAETDYPNMRVVVVDNGSADGGAELAERHALAPTVFRLDQNLGWSGGNNVGIREALRRGVGYLVLLNPDVVVTRDWLAEAVRAMEADPGIGMLDFEGLDLAYAETVPEGVASPRGSGAVRDVVGTIGAALVARAEAVRRVGPLDDTYFLYFEDVDWSWRALEAGYRVVRLGHVLWHEVEGSSPGDNTLLRSWLSMRNSIRVRVKLRPGSLPRWLFDLAVHARSSRPMVHKHLVRLRPYGPVRNLAMVVAAVVWNVAHWPWTLAQRRRERRFAASPWDPR